MSVLPPAVRAEMGLAIVLGAIAGYVDTYGLLALGTYVSFMSGNTTQTGAMTGQGKLKDAWPCALAIVSFVAGCFASTWLTYSRVRCPRRLMFGAIAALLGVVLLGPSPGSLGPQITIMTLSLAMGMLNITHSRVGAEKVNLTFVTGTLNKLGRHLALAVCKVALTDAQGAWDTHFRRACLLAGIWSAFLIGAILSGIESSNSGVDALLAPFLLLLALAVFNIGGD
jgi:uncharacterized membrane protein YoaK (UPF0700 family)